MMTTDISDSVEPAEIKSSSAAWQVQVFFDGECPLCQREIDMLRRFDRRHRIRFTDIADPEFSAADYGTTHAQLMSHIHGRLPDGRWIGGVEVFRQLYSAIGLRWLVSVTRLPILRHMLDWSYEKFAKNRLRWTGRCSEDSSTCEVFTGDRREPGSPMKSTSRE